jgi:FHA domain
VPAAVPAAVAVPVQAESGKETDLPEITVAPEHGASAETVYAVIDEDFDVDEAAGSDDAAGSDVAAGTGIDAGTAIEAATGAETGIVAGSEAAISQRSAGGAPGVAAGGTTSHTAAREPAGSSAAEQVAAAEMTSSYDHLWERTVVRSIEDAAVREDPEAAQPEAQEQVQDHEAAGLRAAAGNPAGKSSEAGPPDAPARPEESPAAAAVVGANGAATVDAPPAVVLDAPFAASPGPARPAPGGLIDSVPWRTADAGSAPAAPPAVHPPVLPAVPAAASGVPLIPAAEAGPAEFDGDHDGQTVMKGSLGRPAAQPVREVKDVSAATGPLVLARLCPRDHANPPTSATCAACGAGLLPDAVQVARPRLGRMRISTGDVVDLDQSLVIGRQPSVSRVQGGVMPRLVQVASPGGDISRSHVEVRLEGWHVMLCDLKATNGTVLVREGQPPRRLAQNEMAILLDGDIAELGDNISLRFEEIP